MSNTFDILIISKIFVSMKLCHFMYGNGEVKSFVQGHSVHQ